MPTTKYSLLTKVDATARQMYDKYHYIKKREQNEGTNFSKWTVEVQEILEEFGILKESRVTATSEVISSANSHLD